MWVLKRKKDNKKERKITCEDGSIGSRSACGSSNPSLGPGKCKSVCFKSLFKGKITMNIFVKIKSRV